MPVFASLPRRSRWLRLLGLAALLAAGAAPFWAGLAAAFLPIITAALGLASIGLFVAPAALLVALTAYALGASRRQGRAAT